MYKVTIIRPVCGIEPYIRETLASSFKIDHPNYEVLFCVSDLDDPAIKIINDVTSYQKFLGIF